MDKRNIYTPKQFFIQKTGYIHYNLPTGQAGPVAAGFALIRKIINIHQQNFMQQVKTNLVL